MVGLKIIGLFLVFLLADGILKTFANAFEEAENKEGRIKNGRSKSPE